MIKKKIKNLLVKIFFLTIGFGGAFSSCDFLDIDPYVNDMFNLDTVFAKQEYTLKYLYNVYSHMPDDGDPTERLWSHIADEGLTSYLRSWHPANYFANDEWNADATHSGLLWKSLYQGIRKSNVFLARVNECDELTAIELMEYTAEAQFLKAYFYFELMLQYGPVVIVPEEPMSLDVPLEELLLPRNTWDSCAIYVERTMREAMKGLPVEREDANFGKPTQASALAVLSRLTLYSASPLFNGNTDYSGFVNKMTGEHYINQAYSEEKWAKAAAVAQELVDIRPDHLHTVPTLKDTPKLPHADQAEYPNGAGGIDPYHSYIDMFNGVTLGSANPEILFAHTDPGHIFRYYAPTRMNGLASFGITQSLVDAYYFSDGSTIENTTLPQTGYATNDTVFSEYQLKANTHNLYMNREMRFYATVGFQNSYYQGISTSDGSKRNFMVQFTKNGNSGLDNVLEADGDKDDFAATGYLCRKFQHPEDSWAEGGSQIHKIWLTYRMAEVYLNYVEAMNELTGSYTINGESVSRNVANMKKYFNMIRFRAGLPGITDADVASVDRMRELIERERQIEFAWEGRRYFDTRRNKTAMRYENQPVMGCNIRADQANLDEYHTRIVLNERSYTFKKFTFRKNFFPIFKDEVDRNPNMDQNPGY